VPGRSSPPIPVARARRNRPEVMQHFLKSLPEPHGQGSLRPSFSTSSFSPPRMKHSPRLTRVSLGKPLRRFEVTSKAWQVGVVVDACHDRLLFCGAPPVG